MSIWSTWSHILEKVRLVRTGMRMHLGTHPSLRNKSPRRLPEPIFGEGKTHLREAYQACQAPVRDEAAIHAA